MMTRNPYDRVLSNAHNHLRTNKAHLEGLIQMFHRYRKELPKDPDELLKKGRVEGTGSILTMKEMHDLGRVNLWLKLEEMPGCLQKLPFLGGTKTTPFPHYRKTRERPNIPWQEEYRKNPHWKELVLSYCEEDFGFFGYDKDEI
jgi:hypothetical protein